MTTTTLSVTLVNGGVAVTQNGDLYSQQFPITTIFQIALNFDTTLAPQAVDSSNPSEKSNLLDPSSNSLSLTSTVCYQIINNTGKMLTLFANAVNTMPMQTLVANASIFVMNGVFSMTPCCVHPDTLVTVVDRGSFHKIPIKDIKSGDQVIDYAGNPIKVMYNLKYIPTKSYVCISKGSLGKGLPENHLLIRRGHPILWQGMEVNCTDLLNGNSIYDVELEVQDHIWSLCTEHRTFVMMEGIPVATWSEIGWKIFTQNDHIGQNIIWWKQ